MIVGPMSRCQSVSQSVSQSVTPALQSMNSVQSLGRIRRSLKASQCTRGISRLCQPCDEAEELKQYQATSRSTSMKYREKIDNLNLLLGGCDWVSVRDEVMAVRQMTN